MHEMSVAMSIVQSVTEASAADGGAISAVSVRVGAMSGVIPEALRFAWKPASAGTPLDGARLEIEDVAAAVFCPNCDAERDLPGQRMVCPVCKTRCPQLVRGRELDILSVEMAG